MREVRSVRNGWWLAVALVWTLLAPLACARIAMAASAESAWSLLIQNEPGNAHTTTIGWLGPRDVAGDRNVVAGPFRSALLRELGRTPLDSQPRHRLRASLLAHTRHPASIEVYDLTGRRVARESARSPQAGTREIRIGACAALTPCVYLVKLRQGATTITTRAAVLQ